MNDERRIQRTVGIFVFVGVLVACSLILHFGKVGDRFRGGYPITVEFANAGGLVRGAQVLFAGVPVGKVGSIRLHENGAGVEVEVDLFDRTGIRDDARFLIKQSGFLGDKHIVVLPVSSTAPLLKGGERLRGTDPFDFTDAAAQAGEAIRKLNTAVDKFSDAMLDAKTLTDLKSGIRSFSELGGKLQGGADRLNVILARVQKGEGTFGKLLNDPELHDELKRLIHNWRVHGLLYREKGDERYPDPKKPAPGMRPP
ncbi:MAG: MCE family protein [Verrucomicrobiae bacterium]|nr:MCE family protein [Verrucomicrobiae bacterium]